MNDALGIKELNNVALRLNDSLDIGERHYDTNEIILSFNKAELMQIQQKTQSKEATGGYLNQSQVFWDDDKEMDFSISHGILSPTSWALLSNSKLKRPNTKSIPCTEEKDVLDMDDYGVITLSHVPNNVYPPIGAQGNPEGLNLPMGRRQNLPLKPLPPRRDKFMFCYDIEGGSRINSFTIIEDKIYLSPEYKRVLVDYTFDYDTGIQELSIGDRLLRGFLHLTGEMVTKDYRTGEIKTAILEIPKIKITTNLSFSLGALGKSPVVSDFQFRGFPEDGKVCQITFLDARRGE